MIDKAFALAASPVTSRLRDYRAIRDAWEKIDGDRLVTLIDLDACFYETILYPRGFWGTAHLLKSRKLDDRLQEAVDDDMYVISLPHTLAKEGTLKAIHSKICGQIAVRQQHGYITHCRSLQQEYDEIFALHYSRIQAVYLGDYLAVARDVDNAETMIALDILAGNGDKVLRVLEELQAIPDYSEHAPARPPRAGKGRKAEDTPPASWGWGGLQPQGL